MAKDKTYTGKDIAALTDREHVRLRTQIYFGNMHLTSFRIPVLTESKFAMVDVEFIPAVYKAVNEIIDNCLDEFNQITSKVKLLKISAEPDIGIYTVEDNGRGIPIDKHVTGKYTPEVALSCLRSGRNFTDEKEVGVIGQNGVGAACTNFCSSEFEVTIYRDNKRYHQKFVDGANTASSPKIIDISSNKTGTQISFQLDPVVFKDVSLPAKLIQNRAIEIAMTNPDVTVEYTSEGKSEKYRFKNGMEQIVEDLVEKAGGTYYKFTLNQPHVTGEFFIIFNLYEGIDEQMFTWVNSSLLFDGGKCNTQFFNAFFDKTIEHLKKDAKKVQCEVTRNDVRQNLLVLANLRLKNPEYDSQAKTRLTGPDLRKELSSCIDEQWKSFARKNEQWLNSVLERATLRHHVQANKKAIEEHEKQKRKRVDGLLDATSKIRSECQLLITEGESAKSQICEARDPKTTAAFALTGKINNVYGATPAQVLKMGKLTDLLSAINLTPGKRAMRGDLRYGKIIIATDADYDGDDIFTLLINLFYQFWPELLDKNYEPIIYRLVAPNVCLVKGNQRIHFTKRIDYEKVKEKYKGFEVRYYKGLGSMDKKDWEMILSGETNTLIPIIDDGKMGQIMRLLFSENADARKEWLIVS